MKYCILKPNSDISLAKKKNQATYMKSYFNFFSMNTRYSSINLYYSDLYAVKEKKNNYSNCLKQKSKNKYLYAKLKT